MAQRVIEIKVISAKGFHNVDFIGKMDVYAIVSLKGSKLEQKTKTHVDKDCGKDPNWNFSVHFTVDEHLAKSNHLNVKFKIVCERTLGDKELGKVNVPVKELLDSPGDGGSMKFVSYQVRNPSGSPVGTLNFSYKFGDKVAGPFKQEKINGDQPVPAYSAAHMAAGSSSAPYVAPPGPYPPPQPAGYGYRPQPAAAAYGGYPPQGPPQPGYGHPPRQPRYGYPPPVQQPPRMSNRFGMGLGARLQGGAYDAGFDDAGGYDAGFGGYDAGFDDVGGYDAGFDDAGGFDF